MGEPMTLAVLPDRSVLHTARDGTLRLTGAGGDNAVAGKIPVYYARRRGPPGRRCRPRFHREPLHLPLLRTRVGHPGRRRAGDGDRRGLQDVRRRQPALPLRPERRRDPGHRQRAQDPRSPHLPRHLLPRRRRHRLRRAGQPLPLHRRRLQPVRLRRLHPDRRTRRPATRRSTPAAAPATATTCAARSCGSRSPPTARTPSPTATSSSAGTDKTRPEIYAMGFRNPFRMSVDKPTGIVYVGDYGPDAGAADPSAAPPGRSSSPGSPSRATSAGRTAPVTTMPTATTTSPPRRPATPSTARPPRTPPRTTPASPTCRPRSPPGFRTTAVRYPNSAPDPNPPWPGPSTTTTPRPTPR